MVTVTALELYPVRSYEVDGDGRLAVPALCNYLQESAGLHARALGVSVEQLQRSGMTWFLWRLHLRIDRLPTWPEIVCVETWPAELGKPYAVRDFRIRIEEEAVGVATSAWLLMDVARQRPIRRLPPRIRDLHPDPPRRALLDRFRPLPDCGSQSHRRQITVRRSDLDLNGHLNHVAAISVMLEAVPREIVDHYRIESLEVEFRGEGRHGDALTAQCSTPEGSTPDGSPAGGEQDAAGDRIRLVHGLSRREDGKELVRGLSWWLPGARLQDRHGE